MAVTKMLNNVRGKETPLLDSGFCFERFRLRTVTHTWSGSRVNTLMYFPREPSFVMARWSHGNMPCLSTITVIAVWEGKALGETTEWHILSCRLFSHSTVCLILLFSQYLSKVDVPMIAYKDKKWKVFQYPLFKLFSVSCQHYPDLTH